MAEKLLVAYATRYGSTEEVAHSITSTLSQLGIHVDVSPMHDIHTIDDYDAIILGAPLYIGKLHNNAHHFLARFKEQLVRKPIAIFALGPISNDEEEMQGSRNQLDRNLGHYDWLKPIAVEMFVGKYDPAKLNFFHKLLTVLPASPIHGLTATDNRNWDAINKWTNDLVSLVEH